MSKEFKNGYVKRTQKDYSMSFKLQVVQEIEQTGVGIKATARKYGIQSHSTVTNWLRKYGNFDWTNQSPYMMSKSKDQQLLELEQKVKLLEKQKSFLEHRIDRADKKSIFFDMMIDLAEKEFKIPIRKNYSPNQSSNSQKTKTKQ